MFVFSVATWLRYLAQRLLHSELARQGQELGPGLVLVLVRCPRKEPGQSDWPAALASISTAQKSQPPLVQQLTQVGPQPPLV